MALRASPDGVDTNKDRARTYKHNIEARSRNHYCREKVISITYSERVSVAFVIRHSKRICRIILFI